jgi:hypothetical protein
MFVTGEDMAALRLAMPPTGSATPGPAERHLLIQVNSGIVDKEEDIGYIDFIKV